MTLAKVEKEFDWSVGESLYQEIIACVNKNLDPTTMNNMDVIMALIRSIKSVVKDVENKNPEDIGIARQMVVMWFLSVLHDDSMKEVVLH